jgi:hypothetical protein
VYFEGQENVSGTWLFNNVAQCECRKLLYCFTVSQFVLNVSVYRLFCSALDRSRSRGAFNQLIDIFRKGLGVDDSGTNRQSPEQIKLPLPACPFLNKTANLCLHLVLVVEQVWMV